MRDGIVTIELDVGDTPPDAGWRLAFTSAVLVGHPSGNEKCDNCLYYLENTADISYCWHPKLRILVGADWWCQWWEKLPDS